MSDQNVKTPAKDRSYLSAEHLRPGPPVFIRSVWSQRRGSKNQVYVLYKVHGSNRAFRSSRSSSKWLDNETELFISRELSAWVERANREAGFGGRSFTPEFFTPAIKKRFIRYCGTSARGSTIQNYLRHLDGYIFPFFCQISGYSRADQIKDWPQATGKFNEFLRLQLTKAGARNRVRTSLRRFCRFAKESLDHEISLAALPINESERRSRREKVIPGDLPNWTDLKKWIETLNPGRARFVITLCAAFGVRVSEALAVTPLDLVGDDDIDLYAKNTVVQQALDTELPAAFLSIREAKKPPLKDPALTSMDMDDREPKSGPYTAVCISDELAELVYNMITEGEDQGDIGYDQVLDTIKNCAYAKGLDSFRFQLYGSHDLRRVHITLTSLEMRSFWLVAQLHGQASESVVGRYYQWGLTQLKRKSATPFKPIKRTKVKPS